MSFTSSLSVRGGTVLVYVGIFFISISMENILQSIVKIIIIGSLYEEKVNCNRQFLPPLPYYQNDDYFLPSFAPPYREVVPVYYGDQNAPPPIPYQNVNPYTPPQLFHQNEKYNPLQFANPGVKYSTPQIFPYKSDFYQPYKPPPKINYEVSQVSFNKPLDIPTGSRDRLGEASSKKSAVFATNIIVKEESQPPYYRDEYNKNYHDEDYTDNYSDDISSQPEPCLMNSPYRYFESPKPNPNNPKDKFTLCNPYFQPNFGNNVYTVKMPITLLPSRFPPRVEQLIERIQNYFSTYTHQDTPKPENQTSTTIQPPNEAPSESETQPAVIMEDLNKKNATGENEKPNFEQNHSEEPEVTTAGESNDLERITQKTIVVELEANEEEISSTSAPDAQSEKESQMAEQNTQNPNEGTESLFATSDRQEFQVNEQNVNTDSRNGTLSENQSVTESSHNSVNKGGDSEAEIELLELKALSSTTETAEERNRTDESSTVQSTNVT